VSPDSSEPQIFTTSVEGVTGHRAATPSSWSYSSLRQAEACPRQWVLARSSYPDLWDGYGYPTVPPFAALSGEIIHRALERILVALVSAGCADPSEPEAVGVMRELGGYSNVLKSAAQSVLDAIESNPRARVRLNDYRRQVGQRISEMRQQTQSLVVRADLADSGAHGMGGSRPDLPVLLPNGVYAELGVMSQSLRFGGRMDLVKVSDDAVRITDFKTGRPDPHHLDQLRAYEVLWEQRDGAAGANQHVTELVLAYGDRDERFGALPPDLLVEATNALAVRIDAAEESVGATEPAAQPAEETCAFCSVRQLCDEYWEWIAQLPSADGPVDTEVEITGVNGPRSWTFRSASEHGVLRTEEGAPLSPGQRVRVLAARRVSAMEEQPVVLSLTRGSEVFTMR
jgi:hypothetical protein